MESLDEEQWAAFERDGYLRLGRLLEAEELQTLQDRIQDIMMGRADLPYERMLMQLDSDTGNYADMKEMTRGHKGPSYDYRKIQDLELDPCFQRFLSRPIFRHICERAYGKDVPISVFRAMFMNKPSRKGTFLPWHQDRWTYLSADPLITTWTALDPATRENGAVQVIPGSHVYGLINPSHLSGFLAEDQVTKWCEPDKIVHLTCEPGETILLHNQLLHASDVNKTDIARRAFSVCYMDARTEVVDLETVRKNGFAETFSPAF